ncbi:MAG TPA: choice-of-anchor R domain-containing protein [Rhizomicrobium sp.]
MIGKTAIALGALAFAGSAALAAGSNEASVSKDGLITTIPHAIQSYAMPTHRDPMAKVIFSNIGFDYPNGLYFCCYGGTVSGPSSQLGSESWEAAAFTPTATGKVTELEIGVGYVSGTNSVNVGLYSDASGVPGTALASADVTGLGTFGSCCMTAILKKRVAVTAGTQYWVVLSTDSTNTNVWAAWNFNSTDQIDPVTEAYNSGTGWASYSGVPAFSFAVMGK